MHFVNKLRDNQDVPKEDLARVIKIYDDLDYEKELSLYEDRL